MLRYLSPVHLTTQHSALAAQGNGSQGRPALRRGLSLHTKSRLQMYNEPWKNIRHTFTVGRFQCSFTWYECGAGCCAKWDLHQPPEADHTLEEAYIEAICDHPDWDNWREDAPQLFKKLMEADCRCRFGLTQEMKVR